MALTLTVPQAAMLYAVVDGPCEVFAPNVAVLQALTKRRLVRCRFVGQQWWRVTITKAGLAEVAALGPDWKPL